MKLTIGYTSSDSIQETWALLIQEQLSAVGISTVLNPVESGAYSKELKKEDKSFDLFFGGYIMGNDPASYAELFTSGAFYNYASIKDPVIDELFSKGVKTFDDKERQAIYSELQVRMQDDAFLYPIVSNNYVLVCNNRIQGFDEAKWVPIYVIGDSSYLKIVK